MSPDTKIHNLREAIKLGLTDTPLHRIENNLMSNVKIYLYQMITGQIKLAQNHDELEVLKKLLDQIANEE